MRERTHKADDGEKKAKSRQGIKTSPQAIHPILQFQRTIGNRAVNTLLAGMGQRQPVQKKGNKTVHGVVQRAAVELPGTKAEGDIAKMGKEGAAYWVYGETPGETLSSRGYGSCVGLVVHDVEACRGLVAHFWNPAGDAEAGEILDEWKKRAGEVEEEPEAPSTSNANAVVFGGTEYREESRADFSFTQPRMESIATLAKGYVNAVTVEQTGHSEVYLRLGEKDQPTWGDEKLDKGETRGRSRSVGGK